MIEHIFRNINDIRIFDVMSDFIIGENEEAGENEKVKNTEEINGILDIDEIMDILEYNEYKRIEIEDSIEHLVRNEILGIKEVKIEGKTGCKICKWTDKLKLPRIGEHVKHKPEEVNIGEIDNYFMKDNELTKLLRSVVYQHVFMMAEKDGLIKKEDIPKKD